MFLPALNMSIAVASNIETIHQARGVLLLLLLLLLLRSSSRV